MNIHDKQEKFLEGFDQLSTNCKRRAWPLAMDISQINIRALKDQVNKEVSGWRLGKYTPKEKRY